MRKSDKENGHPAKEHIHANTNLPGRDDNSLIDISIKDRAIIFFYARSTIGRIGQCDFDGAW